MENTFKSSSIIFCNDDFQPFLKWLKENNSSSRIFIITDKNVEKFCLPLLSSALAGNYKLITFAINPGEESKNIHSSIDLWKLMIENGISKDDLVLNLGGGVISDIGGFVASLFKRGVKFINVPTTLMAMADAAIGGKNGVDFLNYKNMIGHICFPEAVFIYSPFLDSLSDRHYKNGLAEIYKHALIADENLWNNLPASYDRKLVKKWIPVAVKIKADIVEEDPFESGKRKILNFGHTIGHAIESWFLKNGNSRFLHGEAIVAGMIMETMLSKKYCSLSKNAAYQIADRLVNVFGHYDLKEIDVKDLISFIGQDKKNHSSSYRFSLLKSISDAVYDIEVSAQDIVEVFELYKSYELK